MYAIGEAVVYGKRGVCVVKDIGRLNMPGIDRDRMYYTLRPMCAAETIYTPVDTPVFMRRVITREQALALIAQIPAIEGGLGLQPEMSGREMPEYYRGLLETHECADLVRLIVTVYARTQKAAQQKKKLRQTDQNFMRDAENILYGELSVALDIPKEQVPDFIRRQIGRQAET